MVGLFFKRADNTSASASSMKEQPTNNFHTSTNTTPYGSPSDLTTAPEFNSWAAITSTMTSGNILQIPFRRTHNLQLSGAIKSYISNKYDQHPDTFAKDLEVIDHLRRDAVNAREPHASGLRKLQQYAAQLVWMGGKFPVDVRVFGVE